MQRHRPHKAMQRYSRCPLCVSEQVPRRCCAGCPAPPGHGGAALEAQAGRLDARSQCWHRLRAPSRDRRHMPGRTLLPCRNFLLKLRRVEQAQMELQRRSAQARTLAAWISMVPSSRRWPWWSRRLRMDCRASVSNFSMPSTCAPGSAAYAKHAVRYPEPYTRAAASRVCVICPSAASAALCRRSRRRCADRAGDGFAGCGLGMMHVRAGRQRRRALQQASRGHMPRHMQVPVTTGGTGVPRPFTGGCPALSQCTQRTDLQLSVCDTETSVCDTETGREMYGSASTVLVSRPIRIGLQQLWRTGTKSLRQLNAAHWPCSCTA